MEYQLETLKTEFSIIKENIRIISENSTSIKSKIEKLKRVYSEMISSNCHRKIFLFCLESFNFQIKSFSVDTENIRNSLLLIINRIYCDYYKLLNLIIGMFNESKNTLPSTIKERPAYDNLNPLFEYRHSDVFDVHDDVCMLIEKVIGMYNTNQSIIDSYTSKSQTGICILNFIKTLEYDNSVLKDKIQLYLNYMDFFKNTQIKHLGKLVRKMESLKTEIDDEIEIDDDIPPEPIVTAMEPNIVMTVVEIPVAKEKPIKKEKEKTIVKTIVKEKEKLIAKEKEKTIVKEKLKSKVKDVHKNDNDLNLAIASEVPVSDVVVDVIPNTDDVVPNADVVVPNTDVVVPNTDVVVPNTDVVVPNTDVVVPNTDE